MPGFDRKQETLISATDLATGLKEYALVPKAQLQDMQIALLEFLKKNFKRPSIFKSGNAWDFCGSYTPSPASNAQNFWPTFMNGINPVYVLPIGDADAIRIKAIFSLASIGQTNGYNNSCLAFSLSPNDQTTQIPLEQFSLVSQRTGYLQGDEVALGDYLDFSLQTWDEEIPCAGNKFLHIFGNAGAGQSNYDFFANIMQEGTQIAAFTYDLIK